MCDVGYGVIIIRVIIDGWWDDWFLQLGDEYCVGKKKERTLLVSEQNREQNSLDQFPMQIQQQTVESAHMAVDFY